MSREERDADRSGDGEAKFGPREPLSWSPYRVYDEQCVGALIGTGGVNKRVWRALAHRYHVYACLEPVEGDVGGDESGAGAEGGAGGAGGDASTTREEPRRGPQQVRAVALRPGCSQEESEFVHGLVRSAACGGFVKVLEIEDGARDVAGSVDERRWGVPEAAMTAVEEAFPGVQVRCLACPPPWSGGGAGGGAGGDEEETGSSLWVLAVLPEARKDVSALTLTAAAELLGDHAHHRFGALSGGAGGDRRTRVGPKSGATFRGDDKKSKRKGQQKTRKSKPMG